MTSYFLHVPSYGFHGPGTEPCQKLFSNPRTRSTCLFPRRRLGIALHGNHAVTFLLPPHPHDAVVHPLKTSFPAAPEAEPDFSGSVPTLVSVWWGGGGEQTWTLAMTRLAQSDSREANPNVCPPLCLTSLRTGSGGTMTVLPPLPHGPQA